MYLITERRLTDGDSRVDRCALRLRGWDDAVVIQRAFDQGTLRAKPGVRSYIEGRMS